MVGKGSTMSEICFEVKVGLCGSLILGCKEDILLLYLGYEVVVCVNGLYPE